MPITGRGSRWAPPRAVALVLALLASVALGSAGCAAASDEEGAADGPAPTASTTLFLPPPTSTGTTAAPSTTTTTTTTAPALAPDAFARTTVALRDRVAQAGLSGGALVVVRDGTEVLDVAVGSGGRSVPMSVASAAKWLTAATLLTFVDERTISLDDPVARWLPEFADSPSMTVRHLLTHTSGVRDAPCIWQTGDDMARCVAQVAALPLEFPPGQAFSYGNAGFHLVGRIIEIAGADDFAAVFGARVGDPLGMTSTTWPGAAANPSPAAGVRTTVDDYARFLAMLLADGRVGDRTLLTSSSVAELVRNQISSYDTTADAAVAITRIPRYSFGAWPDTVDDAGATVIVSGNGAQGFYPWIDLETRSYGVLGVQDDRGAELAVPASQAVVAEAWAALRP